MNAVPPSMTPGSVAELNPPARKWAALHDAANVVAALAGLPPERSADVNGFSRWMRDAPPWRRELAERGIDDVAAALVPALSALLGIEARGDDARVPAQALWREFAEARAAILARAPAA
jgi:hypothetical protein